MTDRRLLVAIAGFAWLVALDRVAVAGMPQGAPARPADAVPGQAPGGRGGPGPLAPVMSPAEIQRLFDAYLIVEVQQALQLTDQQHAQFLARLKALQDVRRRHQQERMQLLMQLQRLTGPRAAPSGDEAMIKERLAALQELDERAPAELRKAYAGVDEVLTPRQQARFRVLEEQIERRKLELLMRARQQAQPPAPRRRQLPG